MKLAEDKLLLKVVVMMFHIMKQFRCIVSNNAQRFMT